jgi:carbonic anhydrase
MKKLATIAIALFLSSCSQKLISTTSTKADLERISADEALQDLKIGNARFTSGKINQYNYHEQVHATAEGQAPTAFILSCIDSRTSSEIVFNAGIGQLFNARVAGNVVDADILGSMEYACKVVGVKLVVVEGHTSCGAVKGACDDVKLGNLTELITKIKPATYAIKTPNGTDRTSKNHEFVDEVATKNVEMTIEAIKDQSQVMRELVREGKVKIVGAMYDVHTGKVNFLN